MYEGKLSPEELFSQVMRARTRIYHQAQATPLEVYPMEGGWEMLLKREDLSPIHSYKWRGSYNFLKVREREACRRSVAAASAGNHAQGVALAVSRLGLPAHIFMPQSAPRLKVAAARALGGDWVNIHQIGDNFDQAAAAAHAFAKETGALYVPPYDHPLIMAGQGTLGDELMTAGPQPEVVYLQIGGGGLAAGVAAAIKTYNPKIKIIGVEESGQASMKAAFFAGEPVTLDHVDVFCDGTAVKRAGDLTFGILQQLLDDLVTVTVHEVSAAIQELWQTARVLAEPSGAIGLAAARKEADRLGGRRVGIILSGANLDFRQLSDIVRRAAAEPQTMPYYQIRIKEEPGTMLALLKTVAPLGLNIIYLLYGHNDADWAYPTLGFDCPARQVAQLEEALSAGGYTFKNVSSRPDISFRNAPFQPGLFKNPLAAIFNFPERVGAIREFLEAVAPLADLSYFNYVHTGEQVGRAMVVLSFQNKKNRDKLLNRMDRQGPHYQPLDLATLHRQSQENL